jgi:hypothetical protein
LVAIRLVGRGELDSKLMLIIRPYNNMHVANKADFSLKSQSYQVHRVLKYEWWIEKTGTTIPV